MSPINLRVPPDTSKHIDELKKKTLYKDRAESVRKSISLRIPAKSYTNVSELMSDISTPIQSPEKKQKTQKSPKKKISLNLNKKRKKSFSILKIDAKK